MAIPSGTVFSSTPAVVSEKKSALNNARHEGYTIDDIADAVTAVQAGTPEPFQYEALVVDSISIAEGGSQIIATQEADVFEITYTGGSGTITLNLINAGASAGRVVTIIADSSIDEDHELIVSPLGGTISGLSSITLGTSFQVLRVVSNGTNWIKLN